MTKAKITEEMLKQENIPILDYSKLLFDSKVEPVLISGFGKFYKGIYNNIEITIKSIDISIDEKIMNEFIFWKKYQNSPNNFLKLKGAIIYNNSAYIIFDDIIKITLENLLLNQEGENLNEIEKIDIAKQILDIVNILQADKEINGDIRPGTFIINSEKKVKLIDFGMMLSIEDFINKEEIKSKRMNYSPPEYLLENIVNNSYDIYSFGCILIDLFSTDLNNTILMKSYEQHDELIEKIKEKDYPKIPKNLNYLLKEIIKKCINKEPNQRIKINELYFNLNILLNKYKEYYPNNNLNLIQINDKYEDFKNDNLMENEKFQRLKNLYDYSEKINFESQKYEKIENGLKLKIEKMKNDLDNIYKQSIKQLDELNENIKRKIEEIIKKNKDLMKSFYDKTLENLVYFMGFLSNSMSDILDIKNIVPDIKLMLLAYNQFINKEKYEQLENLVESWKKDIERKIKKYTNNKYFDLIDISFEQCFKYVNKNEILTKNYLNEINKLYDNIQLMKNFYGDDKNIIDELEEQIIIQKILNRISSGVKLENIKKENEQNIYQMTKNIYAKIVENSKMITIFNYKIKELNNYEIISEKDNFRFNSNLYSLYDQEKECIYISGGIKDIKDLNSEDNSFIRIDIKLESDFHNKDYIKLYKFYTDVIEKSKMKYVFKINKLCYMNKKRSYHGMIKLSSNKNIILSIGGINTDSCEVYNIPYDNWILIQDLPTECQSPGIIDYKKYLYVFPYSTDFCNIYRMNMSSKELVWESIKYSINEGSLKKGIAIIPNENSLYLFGGYDNNGNYSQVYEVNLDNNDKNLDIKLVENLSLPSEIYFNSNYLKFDTSDESKDDYKVMIMDNFNGVLQYDNQMMANNEQNPEDNNDLNIFHYYLGK